MQQLGELQKHLAAIRARQAEVIAFASRNWQDVQTTQKALGLEFILVSGPNVELMLRYEAYNSSAGVAKPVTVIVDKTGRIRWKYAGKDVNDRPKSTAILAQLQRLQ